MATPAHAREKQEPKTELAFIVQVSLAAAISIALLIPCVWQDHILAGDLSSHVYNAWLAGEMEQHQIAGLHLAQPVTNILTEIPLKWLLERFGRVMAECVIAGCAVLLFFWGAFYFATVVSSRRPWFLSPILAMLAYGLIFHLGFLNFYVSVGLSLWIVGLLWNFSIARALISMPIVMLAFLANAMPLVWAGGALVYSHLIRRVDAQVRPVFLLGALVLVVTIQATLVQVIPSRWSLVDAVNLLGMTGADQVRVFDAKYVIIAAGMLAILCALVLDRIDRGGMLADVLVHLSILQFATYILMPSAIQLPQYKHVLAYLPERMSLLNAIVLFAALSQARDGPGIRRACALVAALFFAFLYVDLRAFITVERRIMDLAAQTPDRSRFVAEVSDPNGRINVLLHSADWACIGHCYSYADYEPATLAFRIQVDRPNSAVSTDMATVQDIEAGRHIVTPSESPIYSVCRCDDQNPPLCLRRLEAGERTCSLSLRIIPSFDGMPGRSARKNQGEIPDNQAGVPVIDQRNHAKPASPNAYRSQANLD